MRNNLQHALGWAQRGFRVFPLWPGSKKPLLKDVDWTEIASADAQTICAWWGATPAANVGVLTDGLIVLDADDKNGKHGSADLIELGVTLDTLTVRTPSGGRHVYFTGPSKENSAGKLAPGLDVRSFHGYVIAPGSWLDPADPDNKGIGGDYAIERDAPVVAAPADLITRLDDPRERQTLTAAVELDLPDALARAKTYLEVDAPPAVEGGAGDITAFKVICEVKDMGVSAPMALNLITEFYQPRCAATWSPAEQYDWFKLKIENAYAYGTRPPGAVSPQAEFAGVQIDLGATPEGTDARWFHHGDGWGNHSWLFYNLLPKIGVGFIIGPPQSGKTFVNIALARALATGKEFFGVEPDDAGGTLLLFGGTEGSGLGLRLAALNEDSHLPIAGTEIGLLRQQGALEGLYQLVAAKMATMLAEHGVPVRLIILETLSASGLLEDENDNAAAGVAMAALGTMARRLGVFFLVSHHPPKNGHGERGAGAFRGSADYVLEIYREGTATIREIALVKAREAPQRKLGNFTLVPVVLGEDDRGRPITSMTVSSGGAGPDLGGATPKGGDMVVECVEWAMAKKVDMIDGRRCADLEAVKEVFFERWTGSKDRTNMKRAWAAARNWAEQQGGIVLHPFADGVYVSLFELET